MQGRETWDYGRQVAESNLRAYLLSLGQELPRDCPTCEYPLEVFRDGSGTVTARCAGRCGKSAVQSSRRQMVQAGAEMLPGFEPYEP